MRVRGGEGVNTESQFLISRAEQVLVMKDSGWWKSTEKFKELEHPHGHLRIQTRDSVCRERGGVHKDRVESAGDCQRAI